MQKSDVNKANEKLAQDLAIKIESLKSQQDQNLKDYTDKYRKLKKECDDLLLKKKNIEDVLDVAFSERKKKVSNMLNVAKEKKIYSESILQEAHAITGEAENIKDLVSKEKENFKAYVKDEKKGCAQRKLEMSKTQFDMLKIELELKDKVKVVNDMRLSLEKEKLTLVKNKESIVRDREAVEQFRLINGTLLNNIKKERKRNEEVISNIRELRKSNDLIVKDIHSNKDKLSMAKANVKSDQNIIIVDKEKINSEYEEIAILKNNLKKKLEDADKLYQEWKNKGR